MSNSFKIYMHICNATGKVYIGQTNRKNINERFGKNGCRYHGCPKFSKAIKKYGWNNFSHIILESNLSEEEVDYKERFYIKLYHSTDKKFGYNISEGGSKTKTISIEIRQRISNSLKGKVDWNTGRKCSEETKRLISEKKKGVSYPNTVVWTSEMRRKQSQRLMGHKMPQSAITKLKSYSGEKAIWYGRHHSEKTKQKLSEYRGEKASWYGRKHTEEYKNHMSKKVSGANNQAYGKHWYNDGIKNIFTYECPIGFHKGKLNYKTK